MGSSDRVDFVTSNGHGQSCKREESQLIWIICNSFTFEILVMHVT
jgi:hypothetical protein